MQILAHMTAADLVTTKARTICTSFFVLVLPDEKYLPLCWFRYTKTEFEHFHTVLRGFRIDSSFHFLKNITGGVWGEAELVSGERQSCTRLDSKT